MKCAVTDGTGRRRIRMDIDDAPPYQLKTVAAVIAILRSTDISEESFIRTFKALYPADWIRVYDRWAAEDVEAENKGIPCNTRMCT